MHDGAAVALGTPLPLLLGLQGCRVATLLYKLLDMACGGQKARNVVELLCGLLCLCCAENDVGKNLCGYRVWILCGH